MAHRSRSDCHECQKPVPRVPTCPDCGALQAPPENAGPVQFFDLMGIETSLKVDAELLRERFYALSRKTHPDRFSGKDANQAAWAGRWSVWVNRAYQTLRDPVSRAEYLLSLHGRPPTGSKQVPMELAETYFEIQEAMEAGADAMQLERFESELKQRLASIEGERSTLESNWDSTDTSLDSRLEALAKHLTLRRFLQSILADLERKVGAYGHRRD